MQEIDFLPKWYTTGRKKKVNYRRQYFALGVLFFVLMIWSLAGTYSVSVSKGQVRIMQRSLKNNAPIAAKYSNFEEELRKLRSQMEVIEKLKQKTRYSAALSELSYLIDEDVVLKDLVIEAKEIKRKSDGGADKVRLVGNTEKARKDLSNERKLKVILKGVAVAPSDVANLISRLERSQYFFNVMPGFSRNKVINENPVTEFEIVCHVADYVEGE
ncbi:hypothetical protein STSP2_02079 [Anaerohalosphaera lusitana]|uniref:Fimbrial assembly protein (PilN) n=1 Tax=Anaerohalosphaera lusitana TaxID=1936003 RepID=A0A1U9NLT0_9BACT|nr:hypothetical protein [Anaerohalosphaera lusitana]AQT68902.1 hypothetical protein STSP2_02079 [Anaerohalosphaera lusitana]